MKGVEYVEKIGCLISRGKICISEVTLLLIKHFPKHPMQVNIVNNEKCSKEAPTSKLLGLVDIYP
jgi:hypothetical protein